MFAFNGAGSFSHRLPHWEMLKYYSPFQSLWLPAPGRLQCCKSSLRSSEDAFQAALLRFFCIFSLPLAVCAVLTFGANGRLSLGTVMASRSSESIKGASLIHSCAGYLISGLLRCVQPQHRPVTGEKYFVQNST